MLDHFHFGEHSYITGLGIDLDLDPLLGRSIDGPAKRRNHRRLKRLHDRVPGKAKALADLIFENINKTGKPEYTKEEDAFAGAVQKTQGLPQQGMDYEIKLEKPETAEFKGGSSDVGDVTLVAPCATLRFPSRLPGDFPGHHWTVVTNGISSIAHKGITAGAKAAAFTAYDLLTRPEVLTRIKKEFKDYSKATPYKSFLPADAEPPLGWNSALMAKYRTEMEKFYIKP